MREGGREGGREGEREGGSKRGREGGREGGRGEWREKTYLKVKRGVVGGECGVQLWVYLQRGSETTTTRDGSWRAGEGEKKDGK